MVKDVKNRTTAKKPYDNYIKYLNETLSLPKHYKYQAIDLFAGCGGLSLGFEAAGIKTLGYEMDIDCCKTYRMNLGGDCICEKLTEDTVFPKVDIVIGGPPCQPFSVRGKQLGKADERNGFPIFIEAIRKIKPKIFVFENVRGVLYKNREYFSFILSELRALGYRITYELLNAVDYDVPQNRERVICVGTKDDFVFPRAKDYVVTSGEALADFIDTIPESSSFLTESMDKYIASYEAKSQCKNPRDMHYELPARTLTCRNLAGATSDMQRVRLSDGRRRRIVIREAARLQSFPDWFEFCGTKDSQYKQIGNAVPPFLAYNIAKAVINHIEGIDYDFQEKQMTLFDYGLLERKNMKYNSYNNLPDINYKKTFGKKSDPTKQLIREALQILYCLGLPMDDVTERQKEKTAMSLLAVGDVKRSSDWKKIKDSRSKYTLTTRKIIAYYNEHFEENLSSGSYDDVRRKDLKHLLILGVVEESSSASNLSDPTRGYTINPVYARIIKNYGQSDWFFQVERFNRSHPQYRNIISQSRNMPKIKVTAPDGTEIELKDGEHNAIQKAIIEEFLPRFGYGATVLYFGDSDNKYGVIFEKEKLKSLGFVDFTQSKLPDVVAYSEEKDWIFLIEAYHTTNPISPTRKYSLSQLMGKSADKAVYVTAFENIASYKSCPEELAWETEVWIVTDPDHMIHLDGHRFLGPIND